MPINKLAGDDQFMDGVGDRTENLSDDEQTELVAAAEIMLTEHGMQPRQAVQVMVHQFGVTTVVARRALEKAQGALREPTMFDPVYRMAVETQASVPVSDTNLDYVDRYGSKSRIGRFLCDPEMVRTIVSVAYPDGDYYVATDLVGNDAVDSVVSSLASDLSNHINADYSYEEAADMVAGMVTGVLAASASDFFPAEEFSCHLSRGLGQEFTAELSDDIFDSGEIPRPFLR